MYVVEVVRRILNRYREYFVISLLVTMLLIYVDVQDLNIDSSIEEVKKLFLSHEVVEIKRCKFNCENKVNNKNNITSPLGFSNVRRSVNVHQTSINEIVINGKRLKLLGIVNVGSEIYALFSCDKRIKLVSQNDTVCDSLKISSINGTYVTINFDSDQYILKILYGK